MEFGQPPKQEERLPPLPRSLYLLGGKGSVCQQGSVKGKLRGGLSQIQISGVLLGSGKALHLQDLFSDVPDGEQVHQGDQSQSDSRLGGDQHGDRSQRTRIYHGDRYEQTL